MSRIRPTTAGLVALAALCSAGAVAVGPGHAWAADPGSDRVVVLAFAREGADPMTAARIERDLRNMFDYGHGEDSRIPRVFEVEPRYDVGHISKADIAKARRHFNEGQRKLERDDPDEALEQFFRAERFYNKAIPFAADPGLLRGIYYYYFQAREAAGLKDDALTAYCAYVALTRNLAGSVGPIEQFEPLADRCGSTKVAGTAELKVTSNMDGAHVYVDNRRVGVVGKSVPYIDPFLPAGPHIIEVRKAGFARWGSLVNLQDGASESLRARLKNARNRKDEYDPVANLTFRGDEAYSDDYILDVMFQLADRFGVATLVAAFLEGPPGKTQLTVFTFADQALERSTLGVPPGPDGHRAALQTYWKQAFGADVDPADAVPVVDRFAPTLFKVE